VKDRLARVCGQDVAELGQECSGRGEGSGPGEAAHNGLGAVEDLVLRDGAGAHLDEAAEPDGVAAAHLEAEQQARHGGQPVLLLVSQVRLRVFDHGQEAVQHVHGDVHHVALQLHLVHHFVEPVRHALSPHSILACLRALHRHGGFLAQRTVIVERFV